MDKLDTMSGRGKGKVDTAIKFRRLTPRVYTKESTAQTKAKLLESTKEAFASFTTSTPKSASATFSKPNKTNMDDSQTAPQGEVKRNISQVEESSSTEQSIIHASFTKEELLTDMKRIITEVVEDKIASRLTVMCDEMKKDIKDSQEKQQETDKTIGDLKEQLREETLARKRIEQQILKMDVQSRRNNLKVINVINDRPREKPDETENILLQAFTHANIHLPVGAIVTARRLGTYRPTFNRTILVTFFNMKDRNTVSRQSKSLQQHSNVRIEDDFPEEIIRRRKILYPIMKNAQRNHRANMNIDQLYIDDKRYTVDTLDDLPGNLGPEHATTIVHNNMVAFFKSISPLSNHHPCKLTYKDVEYNCSEQAYMHHKALSDNKHDLAEKILAEPNPGRQKNLATNIPDFDERNWNLQQHNVMKSIVTAKFSQNDNLKEFLLSTGDKELIEGNPNDLYWSSGLSIYNRKIWNKNMWRGQNQLGTILEEIRSSL